MIIFIPWLSFVPGEGFGINGNILETNLLNLAVVISVVVSLGGDALRSLLETRKAAILENLQEVDRRQEEASKRMSQAIQQVTAAENEAVSIRQQASEMAEKEKKQTIQKAVEDAARMGELRRGTLDLQRQKAIEAISQQVVTLTLQRLQERFATRLDGRAHGSVNNFHTVLFTTQK